MPALASVAMGAGDRQGAKLRRVLEKAIDKDRLHDVIAALGELERHEPREPRWPQRLGDAFKRAGRLADAEDAYIRAMHLYSDEGFLPQAVALGKVIVALDPARAELLNCINQEATRSYRPALPSPPPAPAPAARRAGSEPPPDDPPSFIGGLPRAGLASTAKPLAPAPEAANDEVRFDDVAAEDSVWIDVSDLDVELPPDEEERGPAREFEFAEPLDAERLAQLSGAALLADVSQEALGALAHAAELLELSPGDLVCRRGERADALFVIVEGTARVALPWLEAGGLDLAAGRILGEACLLHDATRQADVEARDRLVLLRIPAADLATIVAEHAEVQEVLFDLLVRRLVTNTLQTSSLFVAFDARQRKELARLFEVRLAPAGCVLQHEGKRPDGLYLLLVGRFAALDGDQKVSLPLGSMIGHRSLLSSDPAARTIVADSEGLVLRMPGARFSAFAMEYPPALAHLSELAAQPLLG